MTEWHSHLRRALRLAARGRYRVAPNPMVGAVVVGEDGTVVGEGWHAEIGGAHAEVAALAAAGGRARGGTLCVTLEPCNHHGRTPPCTEAILAAGVRRVVICHRDPNQGVAGGGVERLRAGGLEVLCGGPRDAALRLNLRFLVPAVLGRPQVTLKWAMSLDGRIATAAGESQWISSPPARRWALALREEHDAVLVGSGTALADDPHLDRRLGLAPQAGVRVVLDRRARLPPEARMLRIAGPVLVYTATRSAAPRRRAIEAAGAEVVVLPEVTPAAVLADLGSRGVGSVLVEGGAEVTAAFVTAGLFDRVAAVVAPKLIGGRGAPGPVGGTGGGGLAAAPRLTDLVTRRRGPDVVIEGLREGCLAELSSSVAGC
ncbi:MAG TPA: bifunctional diaminohydroxyphosphoribosylaminopyrimidine deaminase/5-amino-6-(5-phosphoribosylamino)uracil reductase RibD [Thermoanaerobaculia bacterium]|nr:bifunctional diaminohydroxyphosphoribosylaminopyrimidine deaminase/5-amino-6-(5-phosphoribosylamino)uracil reductase RibD [Thermoanaerobaculia bacterium]